MTSSCVCRDFEATAKQLDQLQQEQGRVAQDRSRMVDKLEDLQAMMQLKVSSYPKQTRATGHSPLSFPPTMFVE